MPRKSLTANLPKKAPTTSAPGYRLDRGIPLPIGATVHRIGVNFSVFSKYATSCTLVLFEPGAKDPFVEYPLDTRSNRTGQVWHAFVEESAVHSTYVRAESPSLEGARSRSHWSSEG